MNRFAAVVLALVGASSLAHANVEVGGTAGLHVFSTTSGLGVDAPPEGETANSLKNSALFAARLGFYFGHHFGVEVEGGMIPTEPRDLVFDVYTVAARANLVYQFRAEKPENLVIPFVLVGGGILKVTDSANEQEISLETNTQFHLGVGSKYRANNGWGVRLDLRALLGPSSDDGQTLDFEALLSIFKEFGRVDKKIVKAVETPKTVDEDPDKDGILGAADQCPTEPEDTDGFEDANGCPDNDNDADGIVDTADKCPIEAEDKDGFEDDNGCPDPDNDGDGVLDAADKCPTEPETKNGYQDEDGCADEIPEALKKFTGAIEGITFKTASSDLAPASNKVLDKAIAVLKEFADIRLEIGGHTDDVQLKNSKKFADNTALSQARADSVKAYFVAKGIDAARLTAVGYGADKPVEAPYELKGAKLAAARAKNRRVEFKLLSNLDAAPAAAPAPTPAP